MKTIFLLMFVSVAAQVALRAVDTPVGTPHVFKQAAGQDLKVYVVSPPGAKPGEKHAAVIFFHGGGFNAGNAGQFADQSTYLASRGLVCINAEYRLLDKERKSAPLVCDQDAKSAVRWVKAHAAALGIDPARLAAGGGSAGGHLAAFAALVEGGDDPADDLKISTKVAALVLFNPAIAWPDSLAAENADGRFREGGEEFLKYAPAKFVTPAAPPTLILSGEKDQIVPMVYLKKFQAQMQAAGVRCEAVFYAGQGHAFFHRARQNGKFYYATLLEVDKFLASLGWIKGPPTLIVPPEAVLK
jgi:acetyl esterase